MEIIKLIQTLKSGIDLYWIMNFIVIVIVYGITLLIMLITKASSDEIITATTIYCIATTIVNGIVYLYP